MRRNLILIFLVISSCSPPRTDKIIVPKLESGFYNQALLRINNDLKSDPSNEKMIDQKLYYCEKLNWPNTCLSALDSYMQNNGMTNQLIDQYIAYYLRHQHYQLLIEVIEKWSEEYQLKDRFYRPFIEALVKSGSKKKAANELRVYMIGKYSLEDNEFASSQYLMLKDTLMASYYLGKVMKDDPNNRLMVDYGKLLVKLSFEKRGFELLENISELRKEDKDFNLMLGRLYATKSDFKSGINKLKKFSDNDTISYLLADWYVKDFKWDSAVNIINKVIERDSLNKKAFWKKARMLEDRGLLVSSLIQYNILLQFNPNDSIVSNRIDLIQRKIAYLQRKKFEENRIQIKEIEPIKINQ